MGALRPGRTAAQRVPMKSPPSPAASMTAGLLAWRRFPGTAARKYRSRKYVRVGNPALAGTALPTPLSQ
jgi:hypothetical protein